MDSRDDDGYTTSDAELDSDPEDSIENELEKDLGEWLDQLDNDAHTADVPPPKPPLTNRRPKITQEHVMDSFRYSVLEGGEGQDIDLDAILGDLCELEATINNDQKEFQESKSAPKPDKIVSQTGPPKTSESYNDLDLQLQSALSVLNDLTEPGSPGSPSKDLDPMKVLNETLSDNASLLTHSKPVSNSVKSVSNSVKSVKFCDSEPVQIKDNNFNNTSKLHANKNGIGPPPPPPVTSPKPVMSRTSLGNTSSGSVPNVTSHAPNAHASQFMSQPSLQISSQPNLTGTQLMAQRLTTIEQDIAERYPNLSPEEQAMKIKEEKMKIALEKIKDANIKKLFVRAYSDDGCSKSILVDEKMTVSTVIQTLIAKNHVNPNLNWTLVEIMPELNMERMLEDHSSLVEQMLMWTRDSSNRILFTERPQKYDMFRSPEAYLTSVDDMDLDMTIDKKQALIRDMFNEETHQVPEIDGLLYVKSEGKKAWKKYYCVLRGSGIYYNPKGKNKTIRDLQCIQKLDFVDVYSGAGWQKKFKAPTEFCFALKHPQIQKKSSKYIRYLCAENLSSMARWIAGVRIAKYGYLLYKNFVQADNSVRNWGKEEVDTNPNFPEYIAKQQEITQHFVRQSSYHHIKRHSADTGRGSLDQNSNGSNRFSVNSVQSGSSSNSSDIEVERLRSQSIPNHQHHSRTGSYSSGQTESSHSTEGSLQNFTITLMDNDSPQESSTDEGFIETNSAYPTKMIPNIPITTNATKYLTEVNSGTLRRSPKKSVSTHGSMRRKSSGTLSRRRGSQEADEILKVEITELPPPPPELLVNNSDVYNTNNGDVCNKSSSNGDMRKLSVDTGDARRISTGSDKRRISIEHNVDPRRVSFENSDIRRASYETNGPRKLSSAERINVNKEEPHHYDEVPVDHTYQTITSVSSNRSSSSSHDSHQYSNVYDQPKAQTLSVNCPAVSDRPLPSPPRPNIPPPTPPKTKPVAPPTPPTKPVLSSAISAPPMLPGANGAPVISHVKPQTPQKPNDAYDSPRRHQEAYDSPQRHIDAYDSHPQRQYEAYDSPQRQQEAYDSPQSYNEAYDSPQRHHEAHITHSLPHNNSVPQLAHGMQHNSNSAPQLAQGAHTVPLAAPPPTPPKSKAVIQRKMSNEGPTREELFAQAQEVAQALAPPTKTVGPPPVISPKPSMHKRSDSVNSSPNRGGSKPPPPAAKPPPPPRNDRTHLTGDNNPEPVYASSGAISSNDFMADLNKAMTQRRHGDRRSSEGAPPSPTGPKPQGAPHYATPQHHPMPPPPQHPNHPPPPPPHHRQNSANYTDEVDFCDLPPPPAELLEGLPPQIKKKPPPPPKRRQDPYASSQH